MFEELTRLSTALEFIRAKRLMPTVLDSAGLAQLSSQVRQRSLFSAKQTRVDALQAYADQLAAIVGGTKDVATARSEMRDYYAGIGLVPENDSNIRDHASGARIDLVLQTNTRMAQGYGYEDAGNTEEALELYPCAELVRGEDRAVPRGMVRRGGHLQADPDNGWPARWRRAAQASGDTDALACLNRHGRMVARKDSPIWEELSEFGQPYPPFAFNSGMTKRDVERDDAVHLGVIDELDVIQPSTLAFTLD